MKLLLDENLSRRIVPLLQADYPGSTQVALLKLDASSDRQIWEYAKINDYLIVTRDSDFHELNTLYGSPPKIIWLKTGNQSKASTLRSLLDHKDAINFALFVESKSCVEIYG